MSKIFFFLLIFSSTGFIFAQDETEPPPTVVEDYVDSVSTGHYKNMYRADSVLINHPVSENTVYPKKFKDNFQSKYKGPEFDYSTTKPTESFWEKLQRKIRKIIESIFGETSFGKSVNATWVIVRLFGILLVGFLLYVIVKNILDKNGSFFFGKKNKKVIIKDEELHENIHEINFPESIAKFENEGDYRSAIRYHFLFILKKLSDKKLISWNPEKTNKDYVAELKAPLLKDEFYNLSYIFEYVWYGEFNVEEKEYLKFKDQYQAFKP
ncbi:protein of unknown function [Chryseobacterium soldanellicola]|uniref:DUF4129 domain-containing protein n=1 Tax=Chryseobacterium soldanellicola TaxID=311333 RepID=A0A1H0ZXX3_9FLAO|nr:DUF4129 domain-containing protein [Chryseobacterium soldanellicola]SDQ32232.1 protein of unknown function [Chryseobacterium soldanellicola]